MNRMLLGALTRVATEIPEMRRFGGLPVREKPIGRSYRREKRVLLIGRAGGCLPESADAVRRVCKDNKHAQVFCGPIYILVISDIFSHWGERTLQSLLSLQRSSG